MLFLFRSSVLALELVIGTAVRLLRWLSERVAFNPRLGPLRYVVLAAFGYVLFAVTLVYAVAPVRGLVGQYTLGEKLRYDAERWLATALYDSDRNFVGTFDARLDSRRDVNYTDAAIEVGDYTANPDHKSIPVREVPEHYWRCLVHQEDRNLGGLLNPFGIDLAGVLKIPVSTAWRSLALGRPSLGVGGSTLPMQLARVIYKTPPHTGESGLVKLKRKLSEWWLAPVIYRELTRGGDQTPLKAWAANHLWLAQRTGGAPLHGVEVTSRVVFGKEAKDLSVAEQYVLASAVNSPIILLGGSETLNRVRLDRWRYITEVRARTCAEYLLTDEDEKKQVLFELVGLAGGPPDPRIRPKLLAALERFAPGLAQRAEANPALRANALMPAVRLGIREEMKQAYGFGWRTYVRGVTTTLETTENLAFGDKVEAELAVIDAAVRDRIAPGYTLARARSGADLKRPNVVVVAANSRGEIVRYYEAGETAPYYSSYGARDAESGYYVPERETRMIASTGKMIAAIAIANGGRDTINSLYLDTEAPERGIETCVRGNGQSGRRALIAFACSLNAPLLNRTARAGQTRVKSLIDAFGFAMPPAAAGGQGTPPSTAAVLGQIAGAPRRVHQMSAVILGALSRRGSVPVRQPTLVAAYDYTSPEHAAAPGAAAAAIVPDKVIRRAGVPLLKALLEAPLCSKAQGVAIGTLKSLSHWCAARRGDLRLHFAKTGTQVAADRNATVDVWITGGLQFANGAAYSYVVLVGTGSEPWGTSLHAAQVAAPLLEVLLGDLARHAKAHPMPSLLPARPAPRPVAENVPSRSRPTESGRELPRVKLAN